MKECKIGTVTLVNDDSEKDIGNQKSDSQDLIFHDPLFDWEAALSRSRLIQSERILRVGGNLASVNYPITNIEIAAIVAESCPELSLKECITVQQGTAYKTIRGLPRRTMTILVWHKGPITERKFYANKDIGRIGHAIYAPEKVHVLTDLMDYKQHYPNRKRGGKTVHVGAMAPWLVRNILHCYVRPGDTVYDSFGGAGTVPAICNVNNITCRSVELDKDYFEVMKKEVRRPNTYRTLQIINASQKAVDKAYEDNSRATNKLGTSKAGRSSNSKEKTSTKA